MKEVEQGMRNRLRKESEGVYKNRKERRNKRKSLGEQEDESGYISTNVEQDEDANLNDSKKLHKREVQKVSLKGDVLPLGKFLASNDKSTRDRAVNALENFLVGKLKKTSSDEDELQLFPIDHDLSQVKMHEVMTPSDSRLDGLELDKLYKGLFYCYWMSDLPVVQQDLSDRLSNLCLVVRPKQVPSHSALAQLVITRSGLQFWKGFWTTLMREWNGIDRHRIDKYLLLIRRFVAVGFRLLARIKWESRMISIWSDVLKATIFNVASHQTPLAITYHYLDIYLQELNRIGLETPEIIIPISEILDPILYGMSTARAGTATFKKSIEEIFEPIFNHYPKNDNTHPNKKKNPILQDPIYPALTKSITSDQDPSGIQSKQKLLNSIFQAGANPDCLDSNRKKIYSFWSSKGGCSDSDD